MGLFDPVERAQRQHDADCARGEALRREEQQLKENRPAEFDAILEHDKKLAAIRHKIVVADSVTHCSEKLFANAKAEAADRAAQARHTDLEKSTKAAEKRVRGLFVHIERKLAEEMAWLAGHVAEIDHYNKHERGDRPFIHDPEWRVRFQPAVPGNQQPVLEEGPVWDPVTRSTKIAMREIGVSGSPGREAFMPRRLADEIRLVDLEGRQIWPPR